MSVLFLHNEDNEERGSGQGGSRRLRGNFFLLLKRIPNVYLQKILYDYPYNDDDDSSIGNNDNGARDELPGVFF